jgi:uncharacterized protein (TIGR02117 family)
VKRIFKILGLSILSFILLAGVYIAAAFLLPKIAVDREEGASNDVTIFILTNGVHTDIVLPIKNEQIDWSKGIRFVNTVGKDSAMKYVAMGWGDKGFYLETPTWADLKFSVAFKAATGLSTSAIHATFYNEMEEGERCKKIFISKDQYSRLIKYINDSFQFDTNGHLINIKTNANYGNNDAFYEAKRSYSLFHTCNTWANNALKKCGQKACWWTPFDSGIFELYK